jgi:hypothetical protein
MNIVDPSLWVKYFLENDIGQSIIDTIKDTDNLYIFVISLYEVYKKNLSIDDSEKANIAVAVMQNAAVIGISPQRSRYTTFGRANRARPNGRRSVYRLLCEVKPFCQITNFSLNFVFLIF